MVMLDLTFNSLYWVRVTMEKSMLKCYGYAFNSLYWVHHCAKIYTGDSRNNFQFPLLGSGPS